jgi:hypothetical protein
MDMMVTNEGNTQMNEFRYNIFGTSHESISRKKCNVFALAWYGYCKCDQIFSIHIASIALMKSNNFKPS